MTIEVGPRQTTPVDVVFNKTPIEIAPASARGPTGLTGPQGSVIYTGSDSPPNNVLGANGDLYFSNQQGDYSLTIYKKFDNAWIFFSQPQGVNFRGIWLSYIDYVVGDIVTYSDGSSYVAIVDPPLGTAPTNDLYWAVFAAAGADGDTGPQGPPGEGVETYDELTDTPSLDIADALKVLRVNAGGTALEHVDFTTLSFPWGQLTGVPASFPPAGHFHVADDVTDFDSSVIGHIEASDLGDLSNVLAATPNPNSVLKFNGILWDDGFVDWAEITGKPSSFSPDEEEVEDIVAGLLTASTNIGLSYDDVAGTLSISTTALSAEEVRDAVAAFVVGGTSLTVIHNDGADTLTFDVDASDFAAASHTHSTSDITSGTLNDARIAESNVTQHEAALTITEAQISDLGSYLTDAPSDGSEYVRLNGAWSVASGGGGSSTWIGLTDTDPASYVGSAGYLVRVNATPNGLEFVDGSTLFAASSHSHTLSDITDAGTAAGNDTGDFEASGAVATHAAVTSGVHGITAFGASLVDDADASAARTTLGLGTAATSATGDFAAASHAHAASDITSGTLPVLRGGTGATNLPALTDYTPTTSTVTGHLQGIDNRISALPATNLTGTLADARVAESNVTQHEAALTITEAQISDLGSYLTAETNDLTAAVTWANVPDVNITESSVTQHEAALTILESQITDDTVLRRFTDTIRLATYNKAATGTEAARNIYMDFAGQIASVAFALSASDTGTMTVRVVNDAGTDTSVGTATITTDDCAKDSSITWSTGSGSFSSGDRIELEPTSGFTSAGAGSAISAFGTRSS